MRHLPFLVLALATPAAADELADVNAAFAATYGETCDLLLEDQSPAYDPEVFTMTYSTPWQDDGAAPLEMNLYRYRCFIGAYNVGHVFFRVGEDGVRSVSFAKPAFTVDYVGDAETTGEDAPVESIAINGMRSDVQITNGDVDAAAGTVSEASYWRGLGDASSTGLWKLVDGEFALQRYEVDGSYDGEVNPLTLWDVDAIAPVTP